MQRTSGSRHHQQQSGLFLVYRFERLQLCGNSFGQQLLVATLRRSFREPLRRTPLERTFREPLWENQPDHFWGAAFGSRFAELVWRVLLVNRFACLGRSFRPALGETPFSVLCIKKIDSGGTVESLAALQQQ